MRIADIYDYYKGTPSEHEIAMTCPSYKLLIIMSQKDQRAHLPYEYQRDLYLHISGCKKCWPEYKALGC